LAFGVLFDIDGTLVTFNFDVQGSRGALLGELARGGFDTSGLTPTSPTQHVIDSVRRQIVSGKVQADFGSFRRRLYDILDEFELKSSRLATVFPGTSQALASLRSMSAKLAVLTNSGRKAALDVLERFGLSSYFEFVLTRDDVDSMKPNPEGVNDAVARLSLPRERVFYVGDSLYDITAAKTAGLKVISVATGNYTAERLKNEGADLVITSLTELSRVLPL